MHRCPLIPDILCTILEFTQQCSKSSREDGSEDQKLGKRTLASLAQTCRAISSPALDRLWMRLDSLVPLILLLPRRIWSQMVVIFVFVRALSDHHPYISSPLPQGRMLISKKRWLRFRQYAVRVQFLHGPCRGIPPPVQFDVLTALVARFPKASLPLLPNLTELVWSGPIPFASADLAVTLLVKFFAGSGVTSLSLFLDHRSLSAPARAVLFDLPNTCPNVTSFTYTIQRPYPQPDITARYIVDIVRRWPYLQALQISPCYRLVMTQLLSMPALTTLGIVVGSLNLLGRLPDSIHTFSLEIRDWDSPYWLGTLQGSPTRFHLRIIVLDSCSQRMGDYFQTLPTHLDNTRLHTLTIEVTQLPYYDLPIKSLSSLTEPLLEPLYAFSTLSALDLSSFCALSLNDAVYARMAMMWPELTSLKVGTSDVSKGSPAASVGAMIAVLRSCPHLQTLYIVFNGSIPPPPPDMVEEEENVDVEGVDEGKEQRLGVVVGQVNGWGVSNRHITRIHVGNSPFWEGTDSLKDLASCLKSVMPRLERIWSQTDVAELWRMVQNLLVGDGAPALRGRPT
ncbi:hypothetical protein HD554DRAFT_1211377 [Boletus coccyginus]|nr:hypothetical protein HD554DRAFT_1211377 [Boletus coccyginus]